MRILNSYMVVRMKSMNRMKVIRRITALVMLFIIIFCFAVTGFECNYKERQSGCIIHKKNVSTGYRILW